MTQSILLIALVIGVLYAIRWISKQPKGKRWQLGAIAAAVVLIGLVATGRAPWFFAIIGAIIPMLRRLLGFAQYFPILQRLYMANRPQSQHQQSHSTVDTVFLEMRLEHESGELDGLIKTGKHQGEFLSSLDMATLIELFEDYLQHDMESAQLVETYLDRTFGQDWRDQSSHSSSTQQDTGSGELSVSEAYAILGLKEGAPREEVVAAHRRLMQKMHPDRGGSDYLAARINEAKDLLDKTLA